MGEDCILTSSALALAMSTLLLTFSTLVLCSVSLPASANVVDNTLRYSSKRESSIDWDIPIKRVQGNGESPIKTVDVFAHGEGGFPCIRIPSITRCGPAGTLHAFAECRTAIRDGCIPNKTRHHTGR